MIVVLTRKSIIVFAVLLAVLFIILGILNFQPVREASTNEYFIDQDEIKSFLLNYGWHIGGTIYSLSVTIPSNFSDKPGEFPEGLYWAYNNELSKDIGLDISLYRGEAITVYIVPLKENLDNNDGELIRAVIAEKDGQIIGSWLDKRHGYGFTASLNRKSFAEIVNKPWGDWLADEALVDFSTGFEAELKKLKPQKIITIFFKALETGNYKTGFALMSKACQTDYLFDGPDKNLLYQSKWNIQKLKTLNLGLSKIRKITRVDKYGYEPDSTPTAKLLNRNTFSHESYLIDVEDKSQCVITFVKEAENYPWKIDIIDASPKNSLSVPAGSESTNINTESQMKSGATVSIPWEDDERFKSAQEANDTFMLMAAYRTVLRDPLPGEEENVHLAARLLAGTVVNPGKVFSQNNSIGPYVESKGFQIGPTYIGSRLSTTIGGGVCKIASTLYNVVILSNLDVVERHAHSMPVPYVPYGQDATVAYGARDFKFQNNLTYPVLVWAQGIDNILYIAFYSKVNPPRVEWHHEVLSTRKAPTVYRVNQELPEGEQKLVLEGMDGAVVKSWITIETPDGISIRKNLGKSYYSPMPYIIEKGSN